MSKYLTTKRVNARIKKYGCQVVRGGDNETGYYFYFLDLEGNVLECDPVLVHKLWHFNLEQWEAAAALAQEQVSERSC